MNKQKPINYKRIVEKLNERFFNGEPVFSLKIEPSKMKYYRYQYSLEFGDNAIKKPSNIEDMGTWTTKQKERILYDDFCYRYTNFLKLGNKYKAFEKACDWDYAHEQDELKKKRHR